METRRKFLKSGLEIASLIVAYPLLNFKVWAETCPTPSATAGPFYKEGAPIRKFLREQGQKGIPLVVSGQVADISGKPVTDAIVEIWHTDPSGDYDLDGFRYRASIRVDNSGRYDFETFLPGAYGGRAQHIHYRISTPKNRELITQLYFKSDPMFEGNPEKTYQKDPIISDVSLIRPVSGNSKEGYTVNFPICLKSA